MSCTVILVPRKVGLPLRMAGRCGCTPGISYSQGTGWGSVDQGEVQEFNPTLELTSTHEPPQPSKFPIKGKLIARPVE